MTGINCVERYRSAKQQLEALTAELSELESNPALQKELEFEQKLRALLGEYQLSLKDVIGILDPASLKAPNNRAVAEKASRKPRAEMIYKHPETGEVVRTRGPQHLVLNAWRKQYGAEAVRSWRVEQAG